MNIYQKKGYTGRREYLMALAEEHEMDYSTVFQVADLLGAGEDFDGLLNTLEDFDEMADVGDFE